MRGGGGEGGVSRLKLSHIQSVQRGHVVQHVTCPAMWDRSEAKKRNSNSNVPHNRREHFVSTQYKHTHTHTHTDTHTGCPLGLSVWIMFPAPLWHLLIPKALHTGLRELHQLTDVMQFKLTWSINHVIDHNEAPFRLELKDPWCGSQIKQKSNLN